MGITFEKINQNDSENLYVVYDRKSSLQAIIAINSTTLGAAIGGCRMIPYKTDEEAFDDVTKLARSMTFKSAIAGICYGGGKSVIIPPKKEYDRASLFKAFGELVNSLQGKYITAIDSGTSMQDMQIVSTVTPFVTGYNNQKNCQFNPSYYTALGVLEALLASAEYKYGTSDIAQRKIHVKGIGNVGRFMVDFLIKKGAEVYISDIDSRKVSICSQETGAVPLVHSDGGNVRVDILCPCDVHPTVTEENVKDITANIIVGATNNQIKNDHLADELKAKDILYCPDYLANSGGLIYVTDLYDNSLAGNINDKLAKIRQTAHKIFQLAEKQNISTKEAADIYAKTFIKAQSEKLKKSA